jgi:hypothetical protein
MKRILAAVLTATLAVGVVALPANAGKKKKVHETFGASLLPFPKNATVGDPIGLTRPGCSSGQKDVHWVEQEFKAPGKGTLRFWTEGFTGDHDIYIFDGETLLLRSDQEQVGPTMAPPEEEIQMPMAKGQTVLLVACNWAGEPDVLAHYEGTFK